MNNSYFSSASNDYSFDYSSPSISRYYYSPSFTPCPVHSSYSFYSSPTQSMNTPPATYSYCQQQQQLQIFSLTVEQHVNIPTNSADRTPLRRHQCFKRNELEVLYQAYIKNSHPSNDVFQQLAIQLKVSVEKVRQWFKNRRYSDKKKKQPIAGIST